MTTAVTDNGDVTTVSLSATASVVEGGSITYTATLDNPAETALSLTLSNGAVINIAAGASTGSASITAGDDVYADAASNYTVSIASSSGGAFASSLMKTRLPRRSQRTVLRPKHDVSMFGKSRFSRTASRRPPRSYDQPW